MYRDVGEVMRWTFHAYTALAVVVGFAVVSTGIRGIENVPISHQSLYWIAGMAIVAAGCAASGLALNDDPVGLRRGLVRFAIGHLCVGVMCWMQWSFSLRQIGVPLPVAMVPLAAGILLGGIALAAWVSQAAGRQSPSSRRLRSAYDEQILQIARREERARLARDLHDAVKQQLFVIQTAAATVERRFEGDEAGAREALTHVRTAAREATTEMEALLDELQAAPMERVGLSGALRRQCDALALRTGAEVTYRPGTLPGGRSLPPGAHEAIYRVAQEALANVARHARASRVDVSLNSTRKQVELRVVDNGKGFDPSQRSRGMGLGNMEERAEEMGGRVSVTGGAAGTEVRFLVPVTNPVTRTLWWVASAVVLLLIEVVVFSGIMGEKPWPAVFYGTLTGATFGGLGGLALVAIHRLWRRA